MLPHLGRQFERAAPILFTGAGFSLSVKNIDGQAIPDYRRLKEILWSLCFPGDPFDDTVSLQDIYEQARLRHRIKLTTLLTRSFSVQPETIPPFYSRLFSMPWGRCYTLNIDDLADAANRHFDLPRSISSISATSSPTVQLSAVNTSRKLQVVHLNGTLADVPDHVTFSATQYGERLARPETWYVLLASEMLSRPVVFIGTRLDEPPLWQHLRFRGSRGGAGLAELRPRSYLVTPHLDKAKKALLAEFSVTWVPLTAEEFTEEVLAQFDSPARAGLRLLESMEAGTISAPMAEVSSLATNPLINTDFLLGEEPTWSDIQSGRAIPRECDQEIWEATRSAYMSSTNRGLIVLTGTAGSGKSTSLMRACLRLSSEGIRVGWIDRYSQMAPREIRRTMKEDGSPKVLAIDDADVFGSELSSMIRDIVTSDRNPLVILGIRSGKIDRVLNPARLEDLSSTEIAMPDLRDSDIDALLGVLDRENRLGILKGKSRDVQEKAFRDKADRQLLVAMFEATSGQRFEEKVVAELAGLTDSEQIIYALVAVATAFRFSLSRDEILLASGDQSNITLNAIEQLIKRHVVSATPDGTSIRARHRFIAETLRNELQQQGKLSNVLPGLALMAAAKAHPGLPRNSRPWRLLRALLNHDFLFKAVGLEPARNLFGSLEQAREWDYHYWLQRGSLEVEFGDLALAQNFLGQARSLGSDDPIVETEWAYLLFKQAIEKPRSSDSEARVAEAETILEDYIRLRGTTDQYPFHVLGSQGLAWSRRGIRGKDARAKYLQNLLGQLTEGTRKHPKSQDLKVLRRDVQKELLNLAIPTA
ncbi:MAG: SIR2 family protein [Thermoanaerobaculia bacterium]